MPDVAEAEMETGAVNSRTPQGRFPRPGRLLPGTSDGAWTLVLGIALAASAGVLAGGGDWRLALLAVAAPAFLLIATASPERTALGLIVLLPFFIYPATVGGFSLFLAIPTFGFVAIVLLTRGRPSLGAMRRDLPVIAFAILLAAAVAAATWSSDPTTAFSRVAYLVLFGVWAYAIAASIRAGRISPESVARAFLGAGALAGSALAIQFLAQFAVGEGSVLDWLFDQRALFAGDRAAAVEKSNWVVDNLDLVRGVFPFMTPASAGQFLMFSLIAGLWLRREGKARTGAGSGLEMAFLIIVAVALLFTLSRQSWLGAGAGIVALGLGRRPLWVLAVAVQLVLIVSLVPIPGGNGSFGDYLLTAGDTSSQSTDTRLELWEQTIDLIPQNAIIGAGPGLIGTLGPGVSDRPFYAHNIFLDAAVEVGIVGVLALLAVFIASLRTAMRRGAVLAFALIAAAIVAGLFDDALYLPRNGLALATAFALIVAGSRSREPAPVERAKAAPSGS